MKGSAIVFLLYFLVFAPRTGEAQVGLSGSYNLPNLSWKGGLEGSEAELDGGYEIGLNYWFRLPKKRVEFLPRVYYGRTSFAGDLPDFTTVGIEMGVQVYPFDFGEDCDCPTFGKQGPKLEKGFYLSLTPGVANYSDLEGLVFVTEASRTVGTLGVGAGLDLGITNLITLTPYVNYRWGGRLTDDIQLTDENGQSLGIANATLFSWQFGLRVGVRFDAGRY